MTKWLARVFDAENNELWREEVAHRQDALALATDHCDRSRGQWWIVEAAR